MIVLGCSTSEITGARIGKGSVPELGEIVAEAMLAACKGHGVHAAFQCCEHLNRGIVVEKAMLKELGLTQVRAIPQPKGGRQCTGGGVEEDGETRLGGEHSGGCGD